MKPSRTNHMMIRAAWMISGLFTIVAVKSGLAAVEACQLTTKGTIADDIAKANGCVEFWANRYQTAWTGLLTVTATLFAAYIAWSAVQRQIGIQEFQRDESEFYRQRQIMREANAELQRLNNARIFLNDLENETSYESAEYPIITFIKKRKLAGITYTERLYTNDIGPISRYDRIVERFDQLGNEVAHRTDRAGTEEQLRACVQELMKFEPIIEECLSHQARVIEAALQRSNEIGRAIGISHPTDS